MHELLAVCGLISIPFVCLYLFYTFVIISLPDHKAHIHPPLAMRLQSVVRSRAFYVVFLLPCLNEAKVVRKTLEAILELPFKHIVAIVIDDASDDNTSDVVKSMSDKRIRLHRRRLPDARKGKGEALNSCYRKLNRAVSLLGLDPQQVIVGVIDGDGRPSLNLVEEAVESFANPRVGAAQARVRISNRHQLLPFMQDLEFAAAVGAMQNAREYMGCVGLGGNGQFTRLSALRSLGDGPWTACLLEDFDLGLRILLHGWEIRFLSKSYVAQQGLVSLRRFIRQRARWVQGNMQCLRYTRDIVRSRLPRSAKLDLLYFLAQPWMNMLGTLVQITAYMAGFNAVISNAVTLEVQTRPFAWWIAWIVWLLLTVGPGFIWVSMYRRRLQQSSALSKLILAGLFFPIYNVLVIPSVWLAFFRHITRKHHWAKTERIAETDPT